MIPAPFKVRGFLFQWPADLLTNCAIEMEVLMLGWFILTETQSVLLLTVFAALRYLGTPIAPMFGMAGDRFGHRKLLCAMRASYAVTAAIMTVLTFAGLLGPIPIFIAAVFAGIVKPSDLVMRNALIGAIMPPEQLMTAMGAAGTTSDVSRILGPLAGAAFVAAMGLGPAFLAIAASYTVAAVLTAMGGQDLAHRRAEGVGQASFVREVGDGLRYVRRTPCLHAGMWLAVLVNVTVIPLTGGLMPYIARDVYHLDRFGLSCLLACFSVGAFCGSIGVGFSTPGRAYLHRGSAGLVHDGANLHLHAQPDWRGHLPDPGRHRSEFLPSPTLCHAATGRRRTISRARHGRPHDGRLWPADGPAGGGMADRAHRIHRHGSRVLRGRLLADLGNRIPLARGAVAVECSGERSAIG